MRDRGDFPEMMARSPAGELVWTRAGLDDSRWPYVELLHQAAALAGARQRALFIGGGGGVALG